jgi:SNF2 family DNA or RNA helicase
MVDPEVLARWRNRRNRKISGGAALAAALTGRLEIDGEVVEFEATGGVAALADHLRAMDGAPHEVTPSPRLKAILRDYQLRGLGWLAQMAELGLGGCLADDMGLGKTVQLIALHLHRQSSPATAGPALVVCPTSLLGNWARELEKFAPDIPVRRYHGGDRNLEDVASDEVVLVTYGVVRRDRAALAEISWSLVVADEAQHAKNPRSNTARELRALPGAARIALTGTPVENRLSELWALLDWTTPGLLGSLESFQRTVAVPVERYHDPDATDRLARVVRPFLLRRRKSDAGVAPELPAKTETDQVVPLTVEQTTLYEAVVRDSIAAIKESEGIARRGMVLKLLTGLKQICNHPAQYLKQPGPLAGRSGKLAALDELLEVILAEGESVLVFTQYVAMARLLEAHLAKSGTPTLFLHGGVTATKREAMVSQFQAGAAPVFLLSLKAGGVGLNLTQATHVVHYDRWWNPAVEDQATDRAYRIGQDRPVQVHRLIAEGTLEDRIATLINAKRALAEAVVGSGEGWLTELSDNELAELVRLGTG